MNYIYRTKEILKRTGIARHFGHAKSQFMIHKTSLGKWAKAITIAITILFTFVIIKQYSIIEDEGRVNPVYTIVLLLVIYFIAFLFRPVCYKITNDKLIIHRLIMDVKIDRKNIRIVEIIAKEKISWSLRILGVGGLFGYFGNFANSKMGRMTWYATRRDRTVLVLTKEDKKIILTPDDPTKFVTDFYQNL